MKRHTIKTLCGIIAVIMMLAMIPFTAQADSSNPFSDVSAGAYYYEPVIWAFRSGVTTGTTATKFAPSSTTTRGQVVTFLWRALGEPEPETTENPFEDIKAGDYYYKPILWAVENGITNGTSAKRFSPDVTCSNAHILTFIWRAMGEPMKTGEGEWYTDAVNWASGDGLLDGTFEGSFDEKGQCPRANVVTYLYRYDRLSSDILRVYVSADGNDGSGDGSMSAPFATITAARNYVRTVDKSKYNLIIIRIGAGEYRISEPITLTEVDSGTESCTIKYIGENNTRIIGGIMLTAKDFTKAEGGLTEYFPEAVRDKIVMVDLTGYGFEAGTMKKLMEDPWYQLHTPFMSLNGTRQTIAEYPNDSWIHIDGAVTHTEDGSTNGAVDWETVQTVYYPEEYFEKVTSWSETVPVFTLARLRSIWCPDDSVIIDINKEKPQFDILFAGGHDPESGTILRWYNVPEELDVPGEYIYDENDILYYYPADGFEDGIITIPLASELVKTTNTDYITFKNIHFMSSMGDGLVLSGKNIDVIGCTISSITENGISFDGNGARIIDNAIYDVGHLCIYMLSGNAEKATGEPVIIRNNDFSKYSVTNAYGCSIDFSGVNVLISHNDCHDARSCGIYVHDSVNAIIEYNDLWNLSQLCEDMGMLSGGGRCNANVVFRYNYVHDIELLGEAAKINEYNPDHEYYGTYAIYFDNGTSYCEAYGNVVNNVDFGYLSNCGRGNILKGNLFINCHRRYISFADYFYTDTFYDGVHTTGSGSAAWYAYTDIWKELNPDLAGARTSWADEGMQADHFLAPGGLVCEDNYYFFNKGERVKDPANPDHDPTYFGVTARELNRLDDPAKVGAMTTYNSLRKQTMDIEEAISVTAKDVIAITWEQFLSIGRIGD